MNIDTLSIARDLKATELPVEQAEAIAAAIGRSVTEGAASKLDLEAVRLSLKSEIDLSRQETRTEVEKLRADLEKLRSSLITTVIGSQIAIAGVVLAIIKL
ncbi:hypothetical protein [Sphingomonas bacterium]|uniref:hypothetical protein n=1 Tax=Sphingomonas bacterium TaxID=1895847 RepID=UPI0015770533|nr:hypothetical protein [Sphingomonas bacterium]